MRFADLLITVAGVSKKMRFPEYLLTFAGVSKMEFFLNFNTELQRPSLFLHDLGC